MDGLQLDAWIRRRFGIAAGGVIAATLALAELEDGAAKKNKKRCRKLGKACDPGGRRRCCGDLRRDALSAGGNHPARGAGCRIGVTASAR